MLNIGDILQNRYRIVKLVGQGGFGAVYRAWDINVSQPVALKENTGVGVEAQRQFEREATLLAGLRHPNLPRVTDHFVIPGQGQYLIMDFVEGKSLAGLLAERGGPLDEVEVLPWIRQVAGALSYLHTRTPPIIHRDIKPENIIVTAEGQAMLVDFGISKLYDPGKGTTIGAKAVTPGYSPPEQYGRGKTEARSDVYALGATLYTLLTGQVPPDGPDLSSGADVLTPPRQANPAVSERTSRAIVAAMAPSIGQRLASAAVLAEALAPAPPGRSPQPASPPALPPTTPVPTRGGASIWPWALGVVALVALSVWAFSTFGGGNNGGNLGNATPRATEVTGVIDEATPEPSATQAPTATTRPSATPATTATPTPTATITPSATPTATAMPEPQAGDVRTVMRGGVVVEQVFVPAGSFMMGSEDGEENERPVHQVTLDAFWIDRTEVTNSQFAAFVADTGYETTAEREGGAMIFTADVDVLKYVEGADWRHPQGPDSDLDGLDAHPVVLVSWDDVTAYATWAGGRLPTEAEWEYAARGPESLVYPWGNEAPSCELLNFDNCLGDTTEVGSYPDSASWIGALDMSGNVWEWVNDWYGGYEDGPAVNPTGPDSGDYKVNRGSSWISFDLGSHGLVGYGRPHSLNNALGFRVVEPLSDPGS